GFAIRPCHGRIAKPSYVPHSVLLINLPIRNRESPMLMQFFKLAAVSPGRQRSFRSLVITHLLILACGAALLLKPTPREPGPAAGAEATYLPILGHVLLILGILEGALLHGWRLTQLPKSQALE